jgi:hypothetical protein
MTRKSELLSTRTALKMRCSNYFTNLYDDKAFERFRVYAESELRQVQREIEDTIQQNKKLKLEFQIPTEELELKKIAITTYLEEKDNLQLVIKCSDNNYTPEPDEYFPTYWETFKITSILPQIKAVKSLLDCFALDNLEVSTEIAKQDIHNFHQVFLTEKDKFKFDTEGQKFLEAIGHILATVLTVGIYAIAQMSYSHYKKNSLMFWKSEPELIQNELDNALKEANFQ